MLAYDLFVMNKDFGGAAVKKVRPVKKIFFNNNSLSFDKKALEEYVIDDKDIRYKAQRALSMPLNTSPALAMPNKVTGSNQSRPYVEFFGIMATKKSGTMFEITCKGKDEKQKINGKPKEMTYKATYDLPSNKREISASDSMMLKIDRENYFVGNRSLFELYVESGILTKDGKLPSSVFKKVCEEFFDFVKRQWSDDIDDRKMDFSLFILPTEYPVEYRDANSKPISANSGTDSFGNSFSHFPSKSTQTAKFLSFDDPAFTLNFAKNEQLYKNLSIGNESHEKINMPADRVIEIFGLNWVFVDITEPEFKFEKLGRGVYAQLWDNYHRLVEKANDPYNAKSQMKIVCYKVTQAKTEVLLDENLTMGDMRRIFSDVKKEDGIPPLTLELLIQKKERSIIWSDYLDAVRALIGKRTIDRNWLLAILSKILRESLFNWLKKPSEANDFFVKSEFCRKVLSKHHQPQDMDDAEMFAYGAGRIAGKYIRFKESVGEQSNSLRDILTYSKYDREKLRFVIQRVGLGISLSKADEEKLNEVTRFVKEEMARMKEIPDTDAHNDYSYFFYRGAFEILG